MNCVPEPVAVYLNEQEVKSLDKAAVLADKYVLTHKHVAYCCCGAYQNCLRDPSKGRLHPAGRDGSPPQSPSFSSSHQSPNPKVEVR